MMTDLTVPFSSYSFLPDGELTVAVFPVNIVKPPANVTLSGGTAYVFSR
jgi:hypothetical protein